MAKAEGFVFQIVKLWDYEDSMKTVIDCVPSTWIRFNPDTAILESQFMPGPCDKKSCELLKILVRGGHSAPDSWPYYPIKLAGRAKTYEEALSILSNLQQQNECIFNPDDGIDIKEEPIATKRSFENVEFDSESLMELIPESRVHSSDERHDPSDDSSSNTSEAEMAVKKRKFLYDANERLKRTLLNREIEQRLMEKERTNIRDARKANSRAYRDYKSKFLQTSQSQSKSYKSTSFTIHKRNESLLPTASISRPSQMESTSYTSDPKLVELVLRQSMEIKKLTTAVNDLKTIVERAALAKCTHGRQPDESFEETNHLVFPMATLTNFEEFDAKLHDKKFRKEFKSSLLYQVDSDISLTRNIGKILRKYMTRNVALCYTAVKGTEKKKVFKGTIFCCCLLDVLKVQYRPFQLLTEKDFDTSLGSVLSNAKDWEGYRKRRANNERDESAMTLDADSHFDLSSYKVLYDFDGDS